MAALWLNAAMSLTQHVTLVEGVDRQPPELLSTETLDSSKAVRPVLSYDAFPLSRSEDRTDSVTAYNVSIAKRAGSLI